MKKVLILSIALFASQIYSGGACSSCTARNVSIDEYERLISIGLQERRRQNLYDFRVKSENEKKLAAMKKEIARQEEEQEQQRRLEAQVEQLISELEEYYASE
jgi:hypothetical protein